MKKTKSWIMVLLAALIVTAMPTALPVMVQAMEPQFCTHEWELAHENAATCTAEGAKFWKCKWCLTETTEPAPALGHAFDGGTVTTPVTCTTNGVRTFTCTRCGEKRTEEIIATGHAYDSITVTREATCTQAGVREIKCTRCGDTKTEEIAAIGHAYQETVTKQPTCTETGTKVTKCTRCNDARTDTLPALGHDWDRSGTVQPDGFTDGEAHAVCRRCGEEETQTLPAGPALFGKLRNTDPNLANKQENAEELVITEQTEGEYDIPYGSGEQITLSVTVEGGVEPYSYEWREVLHTSALNALAGTSASLADYRAAAFAARRPSGGRAAFTQTASRYRTSSRGGSRRPRQRHYGVFSGRGTTVGTEGPTYTASKGERNYYCIITDAAGNKVESDPVSVYHMPYISRQPQGGNLHDGPVTLDCLVSGGRGTEDALYEWFAVDGTLAGEDPECIIREEGEYYCDIYVGSADEPLTSQTVKVFNTEPLKLWVEGEEIEWEPEEGEREIGFYYRGGTAPYTIQWFVNGTLRGEDTITEKEWDGMDAAGYYVPLAAYESSQDTYALTVTDADGETQSAYTTVMPYKLDIEEQPEDGVLSGDGETPCPIEVTLYDDHGDAPFTYILYHANKEVVRETSDDFMCSFDAWEPGYYYIRVEDAKGRYVYSESAKVSPYETTLEIESHTESGKIYSQTAPCALSTYVKGGTAPYTYQWQYLPYGEEEDAGTLWQDIYRRTERFSVSTYYATAPGTYRCIVSDKNGETERTENISVSWAGTGIHIVHEPEDVLLDYREDDAYSAGMYCNAASGSGDDSTLRYYWQKKRSNGLWWPSGSAQTKWAKGSAEDICGVYRCKVYDTKTGTTTYSREVKVDVKLSVEDLSIKVSPGGYYINYAVHGGSAPYDVEFYLIRNLDMTGEEYEYLSESKMIINNDKYWFYADLPYYYYVKWQDEIIEQQGWQKFRFVVTDANGQMFQSEAYGYWDFVKVDTNLLELK